MPKSFEYAERYARLVDNASNDTLSKMPGIVSLRYEELVSGGVVR